MYSCLWSQQRRAKITTKQDSTSKCSSTILFIFYFMHWIPITVVTIRYHNYLNCEEIRLQRLLRSLSITPWECECNFLNKELSIRSQNALTTLLFLSVSLPLHMLHCIAPFTSFQHAHFLTYLSLLPQSKNMHVYFRENFFKLCASIQS